MRSRILCAEPMGCFNRDNSVEWSFDILKSDEKLVNPKGKRISLTKVKMGKFKESALD